MKRTLFLIGFASCLALSAGLNGAAEPTTCHEALVMTSQQFYAAEAIADAVIKNEQPSSIQKIFDDYFVPGLWVYPNVQAAVDFADTVNNFVIHLLKEKTGQLIMQYLQNDAAKKYLEIMNERRAEFARLIEKQEADAERTMAMNAFINYYMWVFPGIDRNEAFNRIIADNKGRLVGAVLPKIEEPQKTVVRPVQGQINQIAVSAQPVQVQKRAESVTAYVQRPVQSQPEVQPVKKTVAQQLKLAVGGWHEQGSYRRSMEDEHQSYGDQRFALFGIYDGHGGDQVAKILKKELIELIVANIRENSNWQIQDCIRKAFAQVEEVVIAKDMKAGSTAIIVLIDRQEQMMYIANLGDCRAVLRSNGQAIALSRDHKASDENEAQRIRDAGGKVFFGRIKGQLAVSRAFGDKDYKREGKLAKVMSEPEIQIHPITSKDQFIIIACDGLWDAFPAPNGNQDATDFVASRLEFHKGNIEKAAQDLVNHAINDLGSRDNVTAMIVTLH